jgi:hypothetical protein
MGLPPLAWAASTWPSRPMTRRTRATTSCRRLSGAKGVGISWRSGERLLPAVYELPRPRASDPGRTCRRRPRSRRVRQTVLRTEQGFPHKAETGRRRLAMEMRVHVQACTLRSASDPLANVGDSRDGDPTPPGPHSQRERSPAFGTSAAAVCCRVTPLFDQGHCSRLGRIPSRRCERPDHSRRVDIPH